MSVKSTATLNWPLTQYAQGFMQDRLAAYRLASLLMPIVKVGAASGTFKKFDDRNSFLVTDTYRGVGGTAKRLKFEATDGTYACEPHALEIPMDDFEPDLVGTGAGAAGAELLAQGKIKSLLSVKATSYAKRAVDFAFASLTPVADRGNFSNESIDPIDQLDEQIDALATDVSSSENITLILSLGVWRKIRMHPKVKARVQGIKTALSRDQFLDTLLLPVNLEISSVSATVTKWGQSTVNKGSLVGNYAILLYSQPNPGLYDPSAFKCFSTNDALVDGVRQYREESARSEVYAVDWSEDMKLCSTLCARLLAIS